jgi:hypothetical protein
MICDGLCAWSETTMSSWQCSKFTSRRHVPEQKLPRNKKATDTLIEERASPCHSSVYALVLGRQCHSCLVAVVHRIVGGR